MTYWTRERPVATEGPLRPVPLQERHRRHETPRPQHVGGEYYGPTGLRGKWMTAVEATIDAARARFAVFTPAAAAAGRSPTPGPRVLGISPDSRSGFPQERLDVAADATCRPRHDHDLVMEARPPPDATAPNGFAAGASCPAPLL
jgi:hypothetical protein